MHNVCLMYLDTDGLYRVSYFTNQEDPRYEFKVFCTCGQGYHELCT